MGTSRAARVVRLWVLAFAAFGRSVAQTAVDGAIGGRVTDASGAAIRAARVLVASAATGSAQVAATDADGSFLVARVVPGAYRVTISAAGFQTVVEPVTVELGEVAAADARLKIAPV